MIIKGTVNYYYRGANTYRVISAAKHQSRSYCAEASEQEPMLKKLPSNDIRSFYLTGRLSRRPCVQGKVINEMAGRQLHDSDSYNYNKVS